MVKDVLKLRYSGGIVGQCAPARRGLSRVRWIEVVAGPPTARTSIELRVGRDEELALTFPAQCGYHTGLIDITHDEGVFLRVLGDPAPAVELHVACD
jgi:hypothetical protein